MYLALSYQYISMVHHLRLLGWILKFYKIALKDVTDVSMEAKSLGMTKYSHKTNIHTKPRRADIYSNTYSSLIKYLSPKAQNIVYHPLINTTKY